MEVFSTEPYDRRSLETANAAHGHDLVFVESRLGSETSALARGFEAVCAFVNDLVDAPTLGSLAAGGRTGLDRQATLRPVGHSTACRRMAASGSRRAR